MNDERFGPVKKILIELIREEGLPVAHPSGVYHPGSSFVSGGRSEGCYVFEDDIVTPTTGSDARAASIEDLSIRQLALLVEEGRRGQDAEQILETLQAMWSHRLCERGLLKSKYATTDGPIPGTWTDPAHTGIRRALERWELSVADSAFEVVPFEQPAPPEPRKPLSPRRLP